MQLDYETLSTVLSQIGADIDASECHGILCGLLCTNKDKAIPLWAGHILEQVGPEPTVDAGDAGVLLDPIIKITVEQLTDIECKFQPVLPGESESISSRTRALGLWAQGFLVGMSFGGIKDLNELPGDSKEIMLDVSKIAQASRYDVNESEEDETAFTEILEYLRAGVMLVYQEINAPQPTAPSGDSIH